MVSVFGCRIYRIPPAYRIPLPAGMTAQQTDVAILAGILNTRPPESYDPTQQLPDEEFNRLIWQEFIRDARSRSWFPESRQGPTIYASVTKGAHYLRAAIHNDGKRLRIEIDRSRGLRQEGNWIHSRALVWMRNLDAHIRREVGRMSVIAGPDGAF